MREGLRVGYRLAYPPCVEGFTRGGEGMRAKQRWVALAGMVVAIGAVLCAPNRAVAKPAEERVADRGAIQAVLSAQQAAWNRGDVDSFLVGYWHSPELTFSGSSGVSRGWDGVMARYKKTYPDKAAMGQLDFSELEFRFLGADAALVLGRWHLKREKDELGDVFSLEWQRVRHGWKNIPAQTHAQARPKTKP